MSQRDAYDFYADMLETHSEIGYLLVVLVALIVYNVAIVVAIWRYPGDDVYLVPGVEACGVAEVAWGALPPVLTVAPALKEEQTVVQVDLGPGLTAPVIGTDEKSPAPTVPASTLPTAAPEPVAPATAPGAAP